jgi:hypothetical protein
MDSELSLTDKPEVANQAGLDNDGLTEYLGGSPPAKIHDGLARLPLLSMALFGGAMIPTLTGIRIVVRWGSSNPNAFKSGYSSRTSHSPLLDVRISLEKYEPT